LDYDLCDCEGEQFMKYVEDESEKGYSATCMTCPADFTPVKGKFGNTCEGCEEGLIFDNDSEECICPAYGASKNSEGKCECPAGTELDEYHGHPYCSCPGKDEWYNISTGACEVYEEEEKEETLLRKKSKLQRRRRWETLNYWRKLKELPIFFYELFFHIF